MLIHPCPYGEDNYQDDEDADKDSKDDEDDFPSGGSSGRIRRFYGIGISDDPDIIIRTCIADDAIESEDVAHIRHDDGFHIQGIYLVSLDLLAFAGEILRDQIDDILKDLFPLVLLGRIGLSVGDDGLEFFEESFHVDSEIGWQDRKDFSFCLLILIASAGSGYGLIGEFGEDVLKQCFLFIRERDILGLIIIFDGNDIGFGIGLIDQSVPESHHERSEITHITGSPYILHRIDEIIDLFVDDGHLRRKVRLEIQEGDGEILGERSSIGFLIIYPSHDRFIFRFVFLEI